MEAPGIAFLALLLGLAGTAAGQEADRSAEPGRQNVLLVILDDIGLDAVGCYPGSNDDAITPVMDGFARQGLRFETVWAYPACSPTRSTILTGKYGFRTGIGTIVRRKNDDPGLALEEVCLPELVRAEAPEVRTAFIGKWHLSGFGHSPDHGRQQGFEHFRGTFGNFGGRYKDGLKDSYFSFTEIENGEERWREGYATTLETSDALGAIESFGDAQWLTVVSYHAAHGPVHAPPEDLRTIELEGDPRKSRHSHFAAMVEAVDREIGRLWAGLSEATRARTTIIIVSDNGTASGSMPGAVRDGESNEKTVAGKGSLGEFGVLVPMIIAGAGVRAGGQIVPHLVGTTDVFATAVELLLGEPPPDAPDSISLVPYLRDSSAPPLREWIFAERFHGTAKSTKAPPVNRLAIRGPRFKLIEDRLRGGLRMYDLESDPRESRNLLRTGEMDDEAIRALARFTVVLAGPLGQQRDAALADLK